MRTLAARRPSATKRECPWVVIFNSASAGKSPTFLVAALKDPIGANLDRIQIIKGWLDAKGETHEKVYDVVWSGDRKPDAKRQASFRGRHRGRPERNLHKHHRRSGTDQGMEGSGIRCLADELFTTSRVLEIPTPRWTAYDAKYFGIKMPPEVPMKLQERAYTSPIWYTPAK